MSAKTPFPIVALPTPRDDNEPLGTMILSGRQVRFSDAIRQLGFEEALERRVAERDSFTRMRAFMEFSCYAKDETQWKAWFQALGGWWTCCDSISSCRGALLRTLRRHRAQWPLLMDQGELEAHERLPDLVKLYRGCRLESARGLSWSLDRTMAESFPFRFRYAAPKPVLVTAIVPKDRVIAVKLDRKENEVIAQVFPRDLQAIEALTAERGTKALQALQARSASAPGVTFEQVAVG